VLQQLVLSGTAPGTSDYRATVVLPAGLKRIDFFDAYTKLAPGSLESTDYFFHTGLASPQLQYEIPFGFVRLFEDELSGFRTKHYAVHRWMNVSSSADPFNITLATDNAPVTAVPGGTFTGTVRQLVAFNDANTAYRAGVGFHTMNFSVQSDTIPLRPGQAATFAHGFTAPLPVRVLPAGQQGPLVEPTWSLIHPSDAGLMITTVKIPTSGMGSVIRVYNPAPTTVSADLICAAGVTSVEETSLLEENKQPIAAGGTTIPVTLGPFEVKTIRASISPVVSAGAGMSIPRDFSLHQNYPNPFNPQTVIRYDIGAPSAATLRVFNVLGQRVRTLASGSHAAGSYQIVWDGRNDDGKSLASGIYFVLLEASAPPGGVIRFTKSMALIR
jgi:hypothetical protein